jgi:CRP-like cAMP-binding protein
MGNGLTSPPFLSRNDVVQHLNERLAPDRRASQPSTVFSNGLLRRFPTALLNKLQPQTRKVVFAGGEYIYRPDEEIQWIYFPETTAISELQILEDGRTIEVSITGPENALGLSALFSPGRTANWVQASVPGTAYKIEHDALRRETRADEFVNGLFFASITSYISQISQRVACNAHHNVEERFSTWLLMVQDRCSTDRLQLTQEHIARVLGVYRPSITFIAQKMREDGLIDYLRGKIVILDRQALLDLCCTCYSELSARVEAMPGRVVKWT